LSQIFYFKVFLGLFQASLTSSRCHQRLRRMRDNHQAYEAARRPTCFPPPLQGSSPSLLMSRTLDRQPEWTDEPSLLFLQCQTQVSPCRTPSYYPFICAARIISTFLRNSFSLSNAIVAPAAILWPPPKPPSSAATVFIADPRSNPWTTSFWFPRQDT
jgi:hypothetical protein